MSGEEPPSLEDLYATVQSGVLSVAASTCDFGGSGSAFLISPTEAITAAHVVSGAVSVALNDDGESVGGAVHGIDHSLDVALIHLDRPVDGYTFTMSTELPRPGAGVIAIGFPLEQPKSVTTGTVSGVERSMPDETGTMVSHLIQIDVPISPGSSGGPVMTETGTVVGLVVGSMNDAEAQGLNYAASASFAAPQIESWRRQPQPPPSPDCAVPLGPADVVSPVGPTSGDYIVSVVMDTFDIYFGAINAGEYLIARERIVPAKRLPVDVWVNGMSSTFNMDVFVHYIEPTAEGATAWVTFTSLQSPDLGPRPGEGCTLWSIDYALVPADDGLMWIQSAVGHEGGPISVPC